MFIHEYLFHILQIIIGIITKNGKNQLQNWLQCNFFYMTARYKRQNSRVCTMHNDVASIKFTNKVTVPNYHSYNTIQFSLFYYFTFL